MHELKTPVTIGKVAFTLPQGDKQTSRLKKIFSELETLITELAKLEQISSQEATVRLQKVSLSETIASFKDLSLPQETSRVVRKGKEGVIVTCDRTIFFIALKNLLCNSLKYGENEVEVYYFEERVEVRNEGNPLEKPFDSYLKPFNRGYESSVRQGLGLGLYLVDRICLLHGFTFHYRYEEKFHIFSINFGENLQ